MKGIKKIAYIIGIFTLLFMWVPKINNVHASTKTYAAALFDKLEIHTTTSTKSKIIGYLKERSKILVYSKMKNGWSLVHYKGKKGYIQSKYLYFIKNDSPNPSAKIIKELGTPPAKNPTYKFKEGGYLYSVDLSKLSKVNFEKTWDPLILDYQMKSIILAIGSNKEAMDYISTIDFVSGEAGHDDFKLDNYSFMDAVIENSMGDEYNDPNGFKGIRMYFIANNDLVDNNKLMKPQAEYLLEFMLKPYLPTGYKKLAEEYIREERYHNMRTDKEWRKIDGLNVRIYFDMGAGEIQIAQKYKSKKTIFAK